MLRFKKLISLPLNLFVTISLSYHWNLVLFKPFNSFSYLKLSSFRSNLSYLQNDIQVILPIFMQIEPRFPTLK